MSSLNINIENHEQKFTVSEMRKRLAQVLSGLRGDQEVTFSFTAQLPNYEPASFFKMPYHEFAGNFISKIPDSPTTRHATMHPALGAPYDLSKSGLWGYAKKMYEEQPTVVYGELARPENE